MTHKLQGSKGSTSTTKYQVLQEMYDEDNIDLHTQWHQIKEAMTTTCGEVVGRKKRSQKEWISAETTRKIQERKDKKNAVNSSRTRMTKAAAQGEYAEAHREVRRSVEMDKRNFVDSLAREAQGAAASRNLRQLYNTTTKLAGKVFQPHQELL